MIQELVAENADMKVVCSNGNNSSGIMKGLTNAGSIIDNFGSSDMIVDPVKNHRTASPRGITPNETNNVSSNLQAKIWSLESENKILNEKLQ